MSSARILFGKYEVGVGSWWHLKVGEIDVRMGKSYIDPEVAVLFTRGDRRSGEEEIEDGFSVPYYRYVATARVLCARLELMGYTLVDAEQEFEDSLAAAREHSMEIGAELGLQLPRSSVLDRLSSSAWVYSLRSIVALGLSPWRLDRLPDGLQGSLIEGLLDLMKDEGGLLLGTLPRSPMSALRHALEALGPDAVVTLDMSSIVDGGYESWDDDHRALALASFALQYASTAKILVIPEGSTDAEVLGVALRLLFPEFEEYFSIMDFGFRPPGGAGNLQNVLKSFAAAGIPNRVLAVVDNDTAGRQALAGIRRLTLPKQYSCITLPNIELAADYPCIGPSGTDRQDVNGRAGSIEMYLGRDVLEEETGSLPPVRWSAYDVALQDYQGEIVGKRSVMERFRAKVRRGGVPGDESWADLAAVWMSILAACREPAFRDDGPAPLPGPIGTP